MSQRFTASVQVRTVDAIAVTRTTAPSAAEVWRKALIATSARYPVLL